MNPFLVTFATMRRHRLIFALFTAIVAISSATGLLIDMAERGFRQSTARAADKFDILVAAAGSQTDIVLTTIFLRPGTAPLINEKVLASALREPSLRFAAPIAFGDSHAGFPIVGTIAAFVEHMSGGLEQGRMFSTETEAVVGHRSSLSIGSKIKPTHGVEHIADAEADEHDIEITVVGRMKSTGTPWDHAIIVPVEQVWRTHSLPAGHRPGDAKIGLPFDPDYLSGVPVVVLKPETIAAAYKLRSAYRTTESMAFFPAEVLVQIYGVLGNVQSLLLAMSAASQVLVLLALTGAGFSVVALSRRQFAVLRILGAPSRYVMLCVWFYISSIIVAGCLGGLLLTMVVSLALVSWFSSLTGVAVSVRLAWSDLSLLASVLSAGLLLALIPAIIVARQKPLAGLA